MLWTSSRASSNRRSKITTTSVIDVGIELNFIQYNI